MGWEGDGHSVCLIGEGIVFAIPVWACLWRPFEEEGE